MKIVWVWIFEIGTGAAICNLFSRGDTPSREFSSPGGQILSEQSRGTDTLRGQQSRGTQSRGTDTLSEGSASSDVSVCEVNRDFQMFPVQLPFKKSSTLILLNFLSHSGQSLRKDAPALRVKESHDAGKVIGIRRVGGLNQVLQTQRADNINATWTLQKAA